MYMYYYSSRRGGGWRGAHVRAELLRGLHAWPKPKNDLSCLKKRKTERNTNKRFKKRKRKKKHNKKDNITME